MAPEDYEGINKRDAVKCAFKNDPYAMGEYIGEKIEPALTRYFGQEMGKNTDQILQCVDQEKPAECISKLITNIKEFNDLIFKAGITQRMDGPEAEYRREWSAVHHAITPKGIEEASVKYIEDQAAHFSDLRKCMWKCPG